MPRIRTIPGTLGMLVVSALVAGPIHADITRAVFSTIPTIVLGGDGNISFAEQKTGRR